jgi:hypothetical protein
MTISQEEEKRRTSTVSASAARHRGCCRSRSLSTTSPRPPTDRRPALSRRGGGPTGTQTLVPTIRDGKISRSSGGQRRQDGTATA